MQQSVGIPRYPAGSHPDIPQVLPSTAVAIEQVNQETLHIAASIIVEKKTISMMSPYELPLQAPPSQPVLGQQFADCHPNTGSFAGPQPSGFFTGNQPTAGQISAESITGAYISTGSSQPVGGSIRAEHISAAFINAGQESVHQLGAGSLTAGKLSVDSITTGPMPAGPITAGELHVGSIGPGQPSARPTHQEDPPQEKENQY